MQYSLNRPDADMALQYSLLGVSDALQLRYWLVDVIDIKYVCTDGWWICVTRPHTQTHDSPFVVGDDSAFTEK
jgi:hypothetical protein